MSILTKVKDDTPPPSLTKEGLVAKVLMKGIHEGDIFFYKEDSTWRVYDGKQGIIMGTEE